MILHRSALLTPSHVVPCCGQHLASPSCTLPAITIVARYGLAHCPPSTHLTFSPCSFSSIDTPHVPSCTFSSTDTSHAHPLARRPLPTHIPLPFCSFFVDTSHIAVLHCLPTRLQLTSRSCTVSIFFFFQHRHELWSRPWPPRTLQWSRPRLPVVSTDCLSHESCVDHVLDFTLFTSQH